MSSPPSYPLSFGSLCPPNNALMTPLTDLGLLRPLVYPEQVFTPKPAPPVKPPLFDLGTAHHEGGHAVSYLDHQGGFDFARVLAPGNAQRFEGIKGFVQGDRFSLDAGAPLSAYPKAERHERFRYGFQFMITALAGPCAEAHYRNERFASHLIGGGASDAAEAVRIAGYLSEGDDDAQRLLHDRAVKQTEAFVARRFGAIRRIARFLANKGIVYCNEPIVQAVRRP